MRFTWKLFVTILCIVAISLSASGYYLVEDSFTTTMEREVKRSFEDLIFIRFSYETAAANTPGRELSDDKIEGIGSKLKESGLPHSYSFWIRGTNGEVLFQSSSDEQDLISLEGLQGGSGRYRVVRKEARYRIDIACQVTAGERAVYLELSRDISDIFLARHRQMEVLVQLTGVILSLSAILIWLLSYFLTRPIRKLSIGTREIARGDYAKRVLVRGHNEVSELAQDFNRMAQAVEEKILSLEEAAHRQEEFTAYFAHELMTPLTSIIGYADMLRSSPLSQEEQLVCANYIFGEGKRLEALSFKLLDLFVLRRGDFSKRRVEAEWLLQSVCNIYRPAGDQAGVVLRVSAQEAALHVEPDLIKTLLLNLVDNARKASQPEQTITIEGRVSGGRYRVEVRDEGRGMEETELGRIQEPFYMVDKSRARQQHGAGLGLSLCREIARFHDTDLSFLSQVGKGTRVWLELEIDVGEEPGEYEG